MSEPRRLNTGDARHIHRTGAPAASPAPTPVQNAGRSISTAQAHSAAAAPAVPAYSAPPAPGRPAAAYQPPRQAAAQAGYAQQTPVQPGYALQAPAPQTAAQPQSGYPARSAAAPQAAQPHDRARNADAYAAARRSAQAAANARARGGSAYTHAAESRPNSGGAARPLTPAQRQEIALRQAQNQHRGADRYAAYTTGGLERAEIEARLQVRQQAEQAARAVQAAQTPEQAARDERAARLAEQAMLAMQAQDLDPAYAPDDFPDPSPDPSKEQPAPRSASAGRHIHRQPAQAEAPRTPAQQPAAGAPHAAHKKIQRGGKSGKPSDRHSGREPGDGSGGQPPRKGKGKSAAGGSGGKGGKNGKGKKKLKWWQILLITLLAIALILGGTIFFILRALRPGGGALGLNALINTPKEFQGDELNFLMIGIDREEPDPNHPDDANVGDGNTDMIMWVHFNKNDNSMRMLQIPRDYMVSTDGSISNNYRINNIAKTQGSGQDDAQKLNMAALCEQVATMFQIPIDGYVSIHIEDLIEMVDVFGGVSLNVPFSMDCDGSHLDPGYQTLNGAAVEFLVRTRHIYPDADIGRLNMQRQFYAALFRRIKEMTMFDLFRHVPAFLNWMETDLSVSDLASFAVSVLKMPSDNIMICQMPVGTGGVLFNGESVVYPARQADADLLNQYFRENTGPVDASQLQLVDTELEQNYGIYPSQLPVTDPNVQFMGDMMRADQEAQQNNNLDGSGVGYFEEDPPAGAGTDNTGDDAAGDAADPAA